MAPPNVLLVILDSVRARNTSVYGHYRDTTPFLESFVDEATVYTQARTPGIHSVASHASIFTGHHVEEHGATDHASDLDPEATIWHALSDEYGYETGLFSPNIIVTVTSNLAEPFDTLEGPRRDDRDRFFQDALAPTDIEGRLTNTEYLRDCLTSGEPIRAFANGLFFLYNDRGDYDPNQEGASEYVTSFLDWSANVDGPWAGCLNLMDAHYPYVPGEEFDLWGNQEIRDIHDDLPNPASRALASSEQWWKLKAVEHLYDGCIRRADAALEGLVTALRERGDLEDTLLVVTSDHGEGFGERSAVNPAVRLADHSWGIHETLTHVPLVVKRPSVDSNGFDDSLASLTAFPSVVSAELEEQNASFAVEDYALASTVRLEDPSAVLAAGSDGRGEYAGPWRAVYEQRDGTVIKHAAWGERRVSLRVRDAQITHPADGHDPSIVDDVFGDLTDSAIRVDAGVTESLDEEVERQLEELGYLR